MRSAVNICFLFGLILFASCGKDEVETTGATFVKSIDCDSDMVALACFEISDKNLVAISRQLDFLSPGWIVKIDKNGKENWRKHLPASNRFIKDAIPLINGGFITIGYNAQFTDIMTICRYDNDGQLLMEKDVTSPGNNLPAEILALSNGNYAIGFTESVFGNGYLMVLDNSFNVVALKQYQAPDQNYFGCFFRGMQQINDSTIALTASTIFTSTGPLHCNSMLIRTDLFGNKRSLTFMQDSASSETANCLAFNNNKLLSVTSVMKGWNNGEGLFIDPFSDPNAQLIAGRINVIDYNVLGTVRARKEYSSHLRNGIILSAKPTKDGGFILCGTTNLNNSLTVASGSGIYLLKLDASLNEEWSKFINTGYQSYGVEVVELNEGGYCLAGHHRANNRKFNMVVIRTDETGNI